MPAYRHKTRGTVINTNQPLTAEWEPVTDTPAKPKTTRAKRATAKADEADTTDE